MPQSGSSMIDFINGLFASSEGDGWLLVIFVPVLIALVAGVFVFNGGLR